MCGAHLIVDRTVPIARQKVIEQLVRAHTDGSVYASHRYMVAVLAERFPPRNGMQIVGIDESTVNIEQHCRDLGHVTRAARHTATACILIANEVMSLAGAGYFSSLSRLPATAALAAGAVSAPATLLLVFGMFGRGGRHVRPPLPRQRHRTRSCDHGTVLLYSAVAS